MANNLEKFDGLWASFITTLKGALRKAAKGNNLDPRQAATVLVQVAMCWQGDFESEGRWINELSNEDPAKGRLVRRILTQDMHFDAESRPADGGIVPQIVGAVGGGAVGYGVAQVCGLGAVATSVTTGVPLVVGAIIGNNYANRKRHEALENLINGYVGQLDSYYHSVVAALNA